ncbi:MAG: NUDIX hydrolase [Candidatus Pacebacteria bacterium]|nr:NUDIX hydrolase [Candidatus Paceibacterota bacterium]
MEENEEHGVFFITQDVFLFSSTGKLLALRHFSGKWLLPGGHINKDEDWQTALFREIEEETGITDLEISKPIFVDNWKNPEGFQYGVFFAGNTSAEEVRLSDEHIEYKWLGSLQEIDELDWWCEPLKERIIEAWNGHMDSEG